MNILLLLNNHTIINVIYFLLVVMGKKVGTVSFYPLPQRRSNLVPGLLKLSLFCYQGCFYPDLLKVKGMSTAIIKKQTIHLHVFTINHLDVHCFDSKQFSKNCDTLTSHLYYTTLPNACM